MPCYFPRTMYPPAAGGRWTFSADKALRTEGKVVPCGQCRGCRLTTRQQWVARMVKESALWEARPLFCTFTYADSHLPPDFSVSRRVAQLLVKRVRKRFGDGIRLFGCGEAGDLSGRPHYHLLFWNLELPDLVPFQTSKSGLPLFRSAALESCWTKMDGARDTGEALGFVDVGYGDVSAMGYVAGYVFKKMADDRASAEERTFAHPVTGELIETAPPFAFMSRRPGIGARWVDEYLTSDARHSDLIVDGRRYAMPPYFRRRVERLLSLGEGLTDREFMAAVDLALSSSEFGEDGDAVVAARLVAGASIIEAMKELRDERNEEWAAAHAADNTADRLAVRHEAAALRAKGVVRDVGA